MTDAKTPKLDALLTRLGGYESYTEFATAIRELRRSDNIEGRLLDGLADTLRMLQASELQLGAKLEQMVRDSNRELSAYRAQHSVSAGMLIAQAREIETLTVRIDALVERGDMLGYIAKDALPSLDVCPQCDGRRKHLEGCPLDGEQFDKISG